MNVRLIKRELAARVTCTGQVSPMQFFARMFLPTAILLLLSCCAESVIRPESVIQYEIRYVVLDSVPPSPTFTVLSASASPDDQDLALSVTQALVGCGVKVLARPAAIQKHVEFHGEGVQAAQGDAISGHGAIVGDAATASAQQGELTTSSDAMALVDSTKADYVFVSSTDGNRPWLQLVKRETKQILFAGVVPLRYSDGRYVDPQTSVTALRGILTSAGLKLDR